MRDKTPEELIEKYKKLVYKIARNYSSSEYELEDLVQHGYIGLLTAQKRFDEAKGYKFLTFMYHYVHGYISRAKRKFNPNHLIQYPDYLYNDTEALKEYLIPVQRFENIIHETNGVCLSDTIADERSSLEDLELKYDVAKLLEHLSPKQLKIIHGVFWENRTLKDLGSELGVTQERARQIKAQALDKLRKIILQKEKLYGKGCAC